MTSSTAFIIPNFRSVPIAPRTALSAVIEIGSEAAFDKKIKSAGSALVIVDYTTTWCGPCKGACSLFQCFRLGFAMNPIFIFPLRIIFLISLSPYNVALVSLCSDRSKI